MPPVCLKQTRGYIYGHFTMIGLHGLVVNARGAFPDSDEITALSPSVLRTIVYTNDELDDALQNVPHGVRIIALLNGEHEEIGHDFAGWPGAIQRFGERFSGRVWGAELLNEWDLLGIPANQAAALIKAASSALVGAGIKRIAGSVAGPDWQSVLVELGNFISTDDFDYGAFHPYGQLVSAMGAPQPGFGPGLAASIQRAASLIRAPIIVTEFGAKISDYGGELRQAEYVHESFAELATLPESVCPAACYFAWHDAIGAPSEQGADSFGLRRLDGSQRPAWFSYQRVAGGATDAPTPPVYDYVLGFKDIHDRHPVLVGSPSENEFGPAIGMSLQRSANGVLYWADLKGGQVMGFLDDTDGRRYVWNGTTLVEVAA